VPDEDIESTPITFDAAWAEYIRLPNVLVKAKKTLGTEERCYHVFADWCRKEGVSTIDAVTPALITKYRRSILARPKQRCGKGTPERITANNYIRHIAVVWSHLGSEEGIYTGVNPFRSVKQLKVDRHEQESKARPWTDVQAIVAAAAAHSEDIHKVFVLAHYFGIRKLEVLRVRNSHIDWQNRRITFHKTKPRRKTYTVNIPAEALEAMLRYRKDGDDYFVKPGHRDWPEDVEYRWDFRSQWRTVFRHLNQKRKQNGLEAIEEFSPHQLRHTLITYLISLGWSLQDVAAYVDQDEVSVTAKYGKKGPELRRETLQISLQAVPE
jgi:integrase